MFFITEYLQGKFHGKFFLWKPLCIVKECWSKSRFCWEMRNGSRNFLDFLRLFASFRFFIGIKFSFSEEFLSICFSLPKVHFSVGNVDNFPLREGRLTEMLFPKAFYDEWSFIRELFRQNWSNDPLLNFSGSPFREMIFDHLVKRRSVNWCFGQIA
jgi:hypothetical protein